MLVIFLEQSSRVITTGTEPLVFGDVWYLVPALIIITVMLLLLIINQEILKFIEYQRTPSGTST